MILLFGISSFMCAQYVTITRAEVQRKKVVVYIKLTSEGVKEFYNNNSKIKFKVTADWGISQLLTQSERKDTFYPTYVSGGSSNGKANAQTMEFECIDRI